jgi:hypothetical protein
MSTPRRGIYTPSELHRTARRLDRHNTNVERVLRAMRSGESLHLEYRSGAPAWSLSGGRIVHANIAAIVIADVSVVPVGAALFAGMPGQTWRFVP